MSEESYTVIVTKNGNDLSGNLLGYKLHEMIKPTEKKISPDDLKKKFVFGNVDKDGNCLFKSLSNLLKNKKDAATIRGEIFKYHTNFKKIKFIFEYNEFKDSLEGAMVTLLLHSGFDNGVIHQEAMEKDKIFGDSSDIVAASLLYKVNINVYMLSGEFYQLSTTGSSKFKTIINLVLEDKHYQDLTPQDSTVNSSETKPELPQDSTVNSSETKPELPEVKTETKTPETPEVPKVKTETKTPETPEVPKVKTETKTPETPEVSKVKKETKTKPAKTEVPVLKKSQSLNEIKTGLVPPPPLEKSKSMKGGTKKRTTKRSRPSLY